jgi:hypothetical protein
MRKKDQFKMRMFVLYLFFLPALVFAQNRFQNYFGVIPSGFKFTSNTVVFGSNIPYDKIDKKRQLFDIFLPSQTGSYPLVINIHGGGFTGGSKDSKYKTSSGRKEIEFFVNQGIAYASIEYRLISTTGPDTSGVKKPLYDVKRALQFIRYYCKALKINPEKIVLTGTSAGAGTSLWLNVHDDMADSLATDPILRQSTKVNAVYLNNPQSTYDVNDWETNVYANYDSKGSSLSTNQLVSILSFERFSNFYGGVGSVNQSYTDPKIIKYRDDIDMLAMLSSDDGAIYIENKSTSSTPQTDPLHHPAHCKSIITFAQNANIFELKYKVSMYSLNNTDNETSGAFLVRHLLTGNNSLDLSVKRTLDLHDKPSISSFYVHPNPFHSNLNIDIDSSDEDVKITVINNLGQIVYNSSINSNTTIDTYNFETGFYLIKLESAKSFEFFRLIKE